MNSAGKRAGVLQRAHGQDRRAGARRRGVAIGVVVAGALLTTQMTAVAPASAAPGAPGQEEPGQPSEPPVSVAQLPDPLDDVGPVEPGAPASVDVPREANKATQQIDPLPALAPEPGRPDVPISPVTPDPPVRPQPLELPTRPAQELIDATAADALATIDRAGYVEDGVPNLDANQLQPQVSRPQVVDDTRPGTLQELIEALLSGNLPPDLGVDPLALLEQLPEGLPRITYRICSESATKEVSCSLTLPLAVPAIVDATGDGTPDVLADLLPAAGVGDVVGAAQALLELLDVLDETQTRLADLIELMRDPLWLLRNPWALLERLRLEELVESLTADVADALEALLDIVHLGLAVLQVRLPTSEFAGQDLPAHIWAVYDIVGGNRLSLGYDGFRRGTSLSTATLGVFTFSPLDAIQGQYDIRASLVNAGAGDALAITAGLAEVADTDEGEAINPTVASARFSPVPTIFSSHADVRPSSEGTEGRAQVDALSNVESHLDTIVMSNMASTDRYVQADVNMLPTSVSAELTWTPNGDRAHLTYDASAVIDDVLFADFTYTADDVTLTQATQAVAAAVPETFEADLTTTPEDTVALDYTASSSLESIDVAYYDAVGEIVLRGGLDGVPTGLNLLADLPAGHVLFDGEQALGQGTVAASLHLGDWAPLDGDHATLVTSGEALGVSARVTGMQTVDAFFDGHPRLRTVFDPGGQEFNGAGNLDGVHKAELHISNLPAEASLDVDTAAQELTYEASAVINLAQVAYTNTADGPTVLAGVHDLPQSVHLLYELGDRPQLDYDASSEVTQLDFFASFDHIENLQPSEDHYLSTRVTGIPTTVDLLVDFPARHLEGTMSDQLDGIDAVARFPLEDRDWTAIANLGGVPAEFDADWAPGTVRMRGISGPLASVDLAAFNHPGPTAPDGLRLAAHYREVTGDIDAAVRTRNLSHVEYSETDQGQTFRLETDTGGDPVFVDVNILLAAGGVDDTQLALLGRIDNVPSTLNVNFADGRLVYTADRNVGLSLEARLGKVAALDGLGAPLFPNGVGLVARTCATGPGCATDETSFCIEAGCVGVVGTINLPGLPTEVVVDTADGTVRFTGYQPPAAPLQAFVRLVDLIDAIPDLRAQATLSGLPSNLDFTLGPVEFAGSTFDVNYAASAPLGDLRLDADLRTTNATYPVVRGRATVNGLPQKLAVSGELGARTVLGVHNSAAIAGVGLTVTSDEEGFLRGTLTDVPADIDAIVDVPASHLEGQMSAPLGGIELLAQNIPFAGDTWGAYLNLSGIPANFDADWANGSFRFRGLSGALGSAQAAVTNHPGAQAPVGSHLAFHFRESTGNLDASASISGVSLAQYTADGDDFTVNFNAASQTIALDGNVVLAAGGADDTRFGALGTIGPIPSELMLTSQDGVITYEADRTLNLELQLWLGKVAALAGLTAPRVVDDITIENGLSLVDASCDRGSAGCADEGPFCVAQGCFGVTGIVDVSGLPSNVTIDLASNRYTFSGYDPVVDRLDIYVADEVFVPEVTRTRALATLTGLPQGIDFTLGPIEIGETVEVGWQSDVESAGRLTVHADADDVPIFGTVNARAVVDPIPGDLGFSGTFGQRSDIEVRNSTAIDELSVVATGSFQGNPATAGIAFTNIPASFDISTDISGIGLTVPNFSYTSPASTLDGLFGIDGRFAMETGPTTATLSTTWFRFTDLGGDFDAALGGDQSLHITSVPATPRVELHTGLAVEGIADVAVDETLFEVPGGFADGELTGHYGFDDSSIGDLSLVITDLADMLVRPANIAGLPGGGGVPPELGWLFPGFDAGGYGTVTLGVNQVDLRPDVDLTFSIGPVDIARLTVDPANFINFHLYDQALRQILEVQIVLPPIPPSPIPIPLCVTLDARPSRRASQVNEIVVDSQNGDQMVNFLDIGDDLPNLGVDLLAYFVSPYANPELSPGVSGPFC